MREPVKDKDFRMPRVLSPAFSGQEFIRSAVRIRCCVCSDSLGLEPAWRSKAVTAAARDRGFEASSLRNPWVVPARFEEAASFSANRHPEPQSACR